MKVSFFIGLFISIIAILVGVILKDYNVSFNITAIIAGIGLLISAIIGGTFISGDRYRANSFSESKEEKNKRIEIIKSLLIFILPNILVAIIIILIKWR